MTEGLPSCSVAQGYQAIASATSAGSRTSVDLHTHSTRNLFDRAMSTSCSKRSLISAAHRLHGNFRAYSTAKANLLMPYRKRERSLTDRTYERKRRQS